MQEVALLCSESSHKYKQNPGLLLVTAFFFFPESDHVLEWKKSNSAVNVPTGSKHLF